jgi:hypothetical protein
MNYNKLWSLVNNRLPTKSAAAKIIKMTHQGFVSMMENRTITVSTLELFADYFHVGVSYFFEDGEELPLTDEPKVTEDACLACNEKQKQINLLVRENQAKDYTLSLQDKLIREYEGRLSKK